MPTTTARCWACGSNSTGQLTDVVGITMCSDCGEATGDEDVSVTGYDPAVIQPGIYGEAEDSEDWWGGYDG